jgi:hypothetical protein
MSEIRRWLETIGLGQHADAFETNEIGMDLLGQVDDQMLKDVGILIEAIGCASGMRSLN